MSINNLIEKLKGTVEIISQCYKEMKTSADNMRVKIIEIWKKS